MIWTPHATVATIVKRNNTFLLVEELSQGVKVLNQPAGHIEEDECIFEAAVRETLEETGWRVKLSAFLGLYTYKAPSNQVTYYRLSFAAEALEQTTTKLDPDIIGTHWLSKREIEVLPEERMRSPLVKHCIEDYERNPHLPLETIYQHAIN